MAGKVVGKITSFTETGNAVTDIPVERLAAAPRDASVAIRCDEHETAGLFTAEHTEPEFTFLALLGASGFLELVIVGESAKMMLGIRVGDGVTVKW